MIYASTSMGLASIEYSVITRERPDDSVPITIELPEDSAMAINVLVGGPLPGNRPCPEMQTQHVVTIWLGSGNSITLRIPSLMIPRELSKV